MNAKIILTKHTLGGDCTLEYGADGLLISISFSGKIEAMHRSWFCKSVPVVYGEIAAFLVRTKLDSVIQERELTFEDFYEFYAYKKGKEEAARAWKRMSQTEQRNAYLYLPKYNASLQGGTTAKLYPASYLNKKRWND